MKPFFLLICTVLPGLTAICQPLSLRQQLLQITDTVRADVGFALLNLKTGDTLSLNGKRHYPMQSVYKFHLALAVLHEVDAGRLSLEEDIPITPSDLLPNTWRPMRDAHPESHFSIPLSRLLAYSASESDNNACDKQFRLMGGPAKVQHFIHKQGIQDITIAATEEQMAQAWPVQFTNWSTPLATVQVLQKYWKGQVLKAPTQDFLWKTMCQTNTGPDRIKGGLPLGTVLGHKTGTSGTNAEGITAAINDMGILLLPDGTPLVIAVYVCHSKENNQANARIIARMTKAVWEHYTSGK
jgi:beta-lactamase class A